MSYSPVKLIYKVTDTHIHGFFDKHRFLSNFHMHAIKYNDIRFCANENGYQAQKIDPFTNQPKGFNRNDFCDVEPKVARKMGRDLILRADWHEPLSQDSIISDEYGPLVETIRDLVMYEINVIKFTDPELRNLLLETGDLCLEETNWWGDNYWGVIHGGTGLNKLGRILMKIRA